MKFLHTADWHLGYRQYGMRVREEDFLRPLNQIADIAVREQVSTVVVAGDMFDNYRPGRPRVRAQDGGRWHNGAGDRREP